MMRSSKPFERAALRAAIAQNRPVLFGPGGLALRTRDAMHLLGWIELDGSVTKAARDMLDSLRKPGHRFAMPGGGPWRILDECPADRHNTTYAARGYRNVDGKMLSGETKCVCPRSQQLMELHAAQSRESQARYYEKVGPGLPRWWTGPWRILDECKASGHNVLARALGSRGHATCTCPRALLLLADYRNVDNQKKREQRAADRARKKKQRQIRITPRTSHEVHLFEGPDFSQGACRNAVSVFDRAMGGAMVARREAKLICTVHCAIQASCLAYAVREEGDKPGSLGGVYGGQDPRDRFEAHAARVEEPA